MSTSSSADVSRASAGPRDPVGWLAAPVGTRGGGGGWVRGGGGGGGGALNGGGSRTGLQTQLLRPGGPGFDPAATKRGIFTQLRWPRSNIAMAARLLAALKNRANRFPSLTRAQFAADARAVAIVATEYVGGPTSTPAGEATPSSYGSWVWQQMRETLVQRFFADD